MSKVWVTRSSTFAERWTVEQWSGQDIRLVLRINRLLMPVGSGSVYDEGLTFWYFDNCLDAIATAMQLGFEVEVSRHETDLPEEFNDRIRV
jgi:hypothetical protein